MSQRKYVISEKWEIAVVAIAGVALFGTMWGTAVAQKVEKNVSKQQRTLALGEDEVKQLLLLMDTDKNGRISRQEFIGFMAAEFDRLDTDKSGELDARELAKSQVRPSRSAVGK